MVHLLQVGLDIVVRNSPLPAWMQDTLTMAAASAAPRFLPFENKEIPLGRHPLQTLYHLLERAIESQQPAELQEALNAVPENLRNALFYEVWSQATDPSKGGDKWGENHALSNTARLLNVIKTVAERKLDELSTSRKNAVFGTIYRLAGEPQTLDLQWGQHNAKCDTQRLIRALNRHQYLDVSAKEIRVYSDLEKDVEAPSCAFQLDRAELALGQIGLHNGMYTSFTKAYNDACKLSTDCAQGHNLHCVYSATINPGWDVTSAVLGQGGIATPPVIKLLEQWQDFFEKEENGRLLQICHSRGAVEVNNALSFLPEELKQRIIVIAVAPACLIAIDQAYKVINLVILADPTIQVAANRDLLDSEHTIKLDSHSDTINPHDMHGSSYRSKLAPMIDTYIRTNDI